MLDSQAFRAASVSVSPVHQQLRNLGLKPIAVQVIADKGKFKLLVRFHEKPEESLFEQFNNVPIIYDVDGERINFESAS